jgi:hypothetical protein
VGWLDFPPAEDDAVNEPQVVCLDYGEWCTGSVCPSFGLPSILMGLRLANSGLPAHQWRTFRATCPDCAQQCDLKVLNQDYLFCPLCRSTLHWREIEADGAALVALASCG